MNFLENSVILPQSSAFIDKKKDRCFSRIRYFHWIVMANHYRWSRLLFRLEFRRILMSSASLTRIPTGKVVKQGTISTPYFKFFSHKSGRIKRWHQNSSSRILIEIRTRKPANFSFFLKGQKIRFLWMTPKTYWSTIELPTRKHTSLLSYIIGTTKSYWPYLICIE